MTYQNLKRRGTKMARGKKSESEIIQASVDLKMQEITACILGVTPFVCNSMPEKARRQLLYPPGKKSTAEKAISMKHNPLEEFRSSPYKNRGDDSETLIEMVAVSFRKAIESIALDVPGATKAQIIRNIVAPQQRIPLYGVPQLFMSVVRSADMNKTPDIRPRAILPEWACTVRIRYPHPLFRDKVISDYLALAGQLRGVGDWRAERGGTMGLFEIVNPDDPRFLSVIQNGGRAAQIAAMESPEMYDEDTRELYDWYEEERVKRGSMSESTIATKANKSNGAHEEVGAS
jgi:hypothetical protein